MVMMGAHTSAVHIAPPLIFSCLSFIGVVDLIILNPRFSSMPKQIVWVYTNAHQIFVHIAPPLIFPCLSFICVVKLIILNPRFNLQILQFTMEKISNNKSKILVIGATGMIGRFLVSASINASHPTFILVRTNTVAADNDKAKLVEDFKSHGVVVVTVRFPRASYFLLSIITYLGDLHDHGSLVEAFKQVDVVISAVGHKFPEQLADQIKIVPAIKEAGNVKRFLPSEFGSDIEHVEFVEPAASVLHAKAQLRHVIREEGIPHTFVCSNCFQGFFLPRFGQPEAEHPPTDKVIILGDGNPQAIFVNEDDMGAYTIKAVDDPRTLNKTLFISPPANFYSLNQLVSLWEKKIGRTLEKIHVSEEDVLKKIQESPYPLSFQFAIAYSVFVKGELTNRAIDPSIAVEATELYPEIKYVKVEDYLDCIM